MTSLIKLARQDPEKLWVSFQCWYDRQSRNKMPCWIIERFDADERPPATAGGLHPRQIAKQFGESSTEGRTEIKDASLPPPKGGGLLPDEVHIHIWDYAIEAIEDYLREFCARNKLELSVEAVRERRSGRRICISQNGRPLLRMHDTKCSTNNDPFICVHLKPDGPAIRTLLVLFENAICPKSLTFYRKLYRQAHPGLDGLHYYRWHIDGPVTDTARKDPKAG